MLLPFENTKKIGTRCQLSSYYSMKMLGRAHSIYLAAAVLTVGVVAGSAVSSTTIDRVMGKLNAPVPSDPVERYQLGFNAFDNPGPKFKPANSTAPRDYSSINYEYGKTRGGKRILVPGEPARKNDRLALIRDAQLEQEYYGNAEFTELGEFNDVPNGGYFLDGELKSAQQPETQKTQVRTVPIMDEKTKTATKSAGLKTVAIQDNHMKIVDDKPNYMDDSSNKIEKTDNVTN